MQTPSALLNRLLARGKFRHIQVLLHLAELGSVQRTAQAIGMTQSSVTQTLAYLESLLDIRLFDRHARGVRPTAACADLLPVARQLLLGLADGAAALAARQNQGEGYVRLIASASAVHGLLLDALPRFSDRHPGIQVRLDEAEGEDQLLAIARSEVDLAICREPPVVPEGWVFEPLRGDRFVVVCRPGHPLARARAPSMKALSAHRWLLLPASLSARRRFDELLERFPATPATYPIVTRSAPMLWQLLQQQDLLALLPLNLVRPLLDAGRLVHLRGGDEHPLAPIGALRPTSGLSAAAARLYEALKAQAATDAPTRP
ncbi:MAG: LysR family transcriptional regulator [Variovorax sp.]|nr:LysR family transcriptional regulator [Variovorax sp.]